MTDISVVVPTYNRSHLIRETLDAILAQTHAPHEIIVVDDGSTDDTRTVLASYGERIRAISIANSGDLVARNTGLRIAQGHLVAFCDSDDLWMPGYLAEMSAQWRAEPRLLSCYSDFRTSTKRRFLRTLKIPKRPTCILVRAYGQQARTAACSIAKSPVACSRFNRFFRPA